MTGPGLREALRCHLRSCPCLLIQMNCKKLYELYFLSIILRIKKKLQQKIFVRNKEENTVDKKWPRYHKNIMAYERTTKSIE